MFVNDNDDAGYVCLHSVFSLIFLSFACWWMLAAMTMAIMTILRNNDNACNAHLDLAWFDV